MLSVVKTESKTGFPLCGVETLIRLWLIQLSSKCCPEKKKNLLFTHSIWLPPPVHASQGIDHDQTWMAYALLRVESSLPSLRAVGGLCLEVSLGAWGPDPYLYQRFAIHKTGGQEVLLIPKKTKQKWDRQAPTSQARPQDTYYLRPSNLAWRTLCSVGHTSSKFGYDPCLVR